jgi:hypothetical protein
LIKQTSFEERMSSIKNIIDYVKHEENGFGEKKFCAVDSLVLSQFAYLSFDMVVPGFSEKKKNAHIRIKDIFIEEKLPDIITQVRAPRNNKKLFAALARSPRFQNVAMNYYINEIDYEVEKQFSAVTFLLDENTAYIAFRGTDFTFVGWKEDFNMAFLSEIPAQAQAVKYLEKVAKKFHGSLIIGGHSKGGNLAVYASMMCKRSLQKRILAVYSHDGPGFKENILNSLQFQKIKNRVYKTIPQSSIVGMLLEHQEEYTIVKSNRLGIMQHDPFSWEIKNDNFHVLNNISSTSQSMNKALHDWLVKLSDTDRERFVDALYEIIKASNKTSISDFQKIKLKDINAMFKAPNNMDAQTRELLFQALKSLIALSVVNMKPHIEIPALQNHKSSEES